MSEVLTQLIISMIIRHSQTRLHIFPRRSRSYPRTMLWTNMKPGFAQADIASAGAMDEETSDDDSIGGLLTKHPQLQLRLASCRP